VRGSSLPGHAMSAATWFGNDRVMAWKHRLHSL
jgi:hypothetical protein